MTNPPRKTNWFRTRSAMLAALSHKGLRHLNFTEEKSIQGHRPVFTLSDLAEIRLVKVHGYAIIVSGDHAKKD